MTDTVKYLQDEYYIFRDGFIADYDVGETVIESEVQAAFFQMKYEAAINNSWQDISTIPPNGNFLAAWPEIELDEDGDLTDKKTGKYFIGAINMAGGQPNGEADSLNAMGDWYGDDTCWAPEPSHWMHLPAPPEDK